jgi:hypothetical protein
MTWFGGPGYLVLLAAVVVIQLAVDWWLLHTGRVVHYKLVSHRKLRASRCARTASVDLVDVEAGPRPVLIRPDAGTQLRTAAAVRIGGAAVSTSSETPHPAPGHPGTLPPGAGPTPQTAADASRSALYTLASSSGGGLGPQQPATVGTPDSAVAGPQPHPRDEEVAGVTAPRTVTPATAPLDAGAVAQTAPARSPA